MYTRAAKLKHLRFRGLQMHIGSQITEVNPFEQAVRKVLPLVQKLKHAYGLKFSASEAAWESSTARAGQRIGDLVEIEGSEKHSDS